MSVRDEAGTFEPLTETQCWELLRDGDIGRISWADGDELAVFPVNYVVDGDALLVRTDPQGPIAGGVVDARAAFQVDDLYPRGRIGATVLAQVRAEPVDDDETQRRAQRLGLHPWATGDRSCYLRLTVTSISGRRLRYVVIST